MSVGGLDVSRLSGSDAVVALRSYPRRYAAALSEHEGEADIDELVRRAGPDTRAVIDLVFNTIDTFGLLGRAMREMLVDDQPALAPGVGDPSSRDSKAPPGLGVDAALAQLSGEVGAIAELAGGVRGDDWNRHGKTPDGRKLTILDALHEAVRAGSVNLRTIEDALAAIRSHDQ